MRPSSPTVRVIENASIGQKLGDEPIGSPVYCSPAYCMIAVDPGHATHQYTCFQLLSPGWPGSGHCLTRTAY